MTLASTLLLFSACSQAQPVVEKPAPVVQQSAEIVQLSSAKEALTSFFHHLAKNEFEKAVQLYSTDEADWYTPEIYAQEDHKKDRAKILEDFCKATGTCLEIEVLSAKDPKDNDYEFTVQFREKDGSIMLYGPFGGVENDKTPPQTKFEYHVKKVGDLYKVITPPLYRP